MKAIFLGMGLMVLISCLAWLITGTQTTSSGAYYQSSNVRLD